MRQSERLRGSAEEGDEQSRRRSWSDAVRTSHSRLRTLDEASQIPINLNRQIRELEALLSLRKRSTANCSNRQKGSFLATSRSPLTTRISNRELLGLEISQLVENKHPQPVLIANFEPNHFPAFRAYVAAAFKRAGSPLLLAALEPAGRSGKSSQRSGCSK
jgi:hypothetical protein